MDEEAVVGADRLALAKDAGVDEVGLCVEEPHADVERVAVVENVDLGALARRVALDGRYLMEVGERRRAHPQLFAQVAVDRRRFGRALDADGLLLGIDRRRLRRGSAHRATRRASAAHARRAPSQARREPRDRWSDTGRLLLVFVRSRGRSGSVHEILCNIGTYGADRCTTSREKFRPKMTVQLVF